MKTEKAFLAKLLPDLRKLLEPKGAVIFKHNDFYTSGVPDFTITIDGRTTWWEAKLAPNEPTKLQRYFLDRLAPNAFVITYSNQSKLVTIQWKESTALHTYKETLEIIAMFGSRKEDEL